MSIQRISKDNIEVFALNTYPERTYTSSSSGITGSVLLFARENRVLKDAYANEDYGASALQTNTLEEFRMSLSLAARTPGANISGDVESYLTGVNLTPPSEAWSKKLEVTRFVPGVKFGKDTLRKSAIKDTLFPYYRTAYPCLEWGFTNYHTLNFFTASTVPPTSALIYPAGTGTLVPGDSFPYSPSGSFTFEFYINPRYTTDLPHGDFKAGTILHLSSSYSISLISGSGKDINGYLDTYKIMLQLSHSADIAPSKVAPGGSGFITSLAGYKPDLIFTSSEIPKNSWSHVAIRWEAPNINGTNPGKYTGSFVIDGKKDTEFYISSSSLIPQSFANPQGDPDALFVGNYYDGPNQGAFVEPPLLSRFFNAYAAYHEGLTPYYSDVVDDTTAPIGPSLTDIPVDKYNLSHPLNAEVHDIRIYDHHRTVGDIENDRRSGPDNLDGLLFYLPPFFVRESRLRDVLQTPFKSIRSTTDDPFNVALSFGVAGRLINVPNFTREFVRAEYPRLFHLSASETTATTTAQPANTLLYQNPSTVKGNLTILPCDNGLFDPNFNLLMSGVNSDVSPPLKGSPTEKFVSDLGKLRYDLVNLNGMVLTSSYFTNIVSFDAVATGTIPSALEGATPEDPGIESGPVLTVLNRTRDPSSNEVTFFDISNLFYGNRIMPETFSVFDASLSGSDGKVSMRLRDSAAGGLYRADSNTTHAQWSLVGSIIRNEGLAVVTDPTAMFFGQDQFEVNLKGSKPLFVKEINVLAPAGSVNSSSNPNWIPLPPTDNANETADKFVYITHVNLHDDNLNIVGKASLAQPLVKRSDDRFLVRLKIDY